MRGDTADVTIVVPCYNTQRYLDQALTSAEQNARCNVEILVINDGSTDDSLTIMQRHASHDARVRVIDKPNEGYGATVNRGIDEAQGAYVAILEPDDWVLPHTYDNLFALACAHDKPDVVKTAYWRVLSHENADGMMAYGYLHGRVRNVGKRITLADEPQLIQYHPSVWSALYAKSHLDREGVRMREVPGAGWVDNPFCVASLVSARSIVYSDDAYYCYREDLSSASSATVSARLMIERWMDRADVLESRGVTDEGIVRANTIVGLRFMAAIMKTNALEDQDLLETARMMAFRMDESVFKTVDCISPHVIQSVLQLKGSAESTPSEVYYLAHLAREGVWALRNNGIRFFAYNLALARNN